MLLHVTSSSVLPPIVLLLDLQHLVQVDLRQSFALLGLQSQGEGNGGVVVREGEYLDDQCEFIDAPPERLVLEDIDNELRRDLPRCVAHCSV